MNIIKIFHNSDSLSVVFCLYLLQCLFLVGFLFFFSRLFASAAEKVLRYLDAVAPFIYPPLAEERAWPSVRG